MKKLLFLGACLVALASSPVVAQTGGADVVVVRVYSGNYSRIVIAREGGKTEVLDFHAGITEKRDKEAATELQQVVSSLYREGYELKSTFSEQNSYTANLIFIKPK
ncbi:hypothetical protein FNT36_14455 [Hymenobacter setariae]|uniref:DUF4907 domain-containing protein n=1 Tax=Hymenobacter setariae TaxID=2594794 RepID=A0A558BVW4_9BACT|nr:hypothetical protein [Hymenobacter setariae]TVT40666.1 hypothetical protein FNT36_14455 [Hymenobacter setariae]